MPIPRFHLPQAKSADTMKVYSRPVITSRCLLLHIAAILFIKTIVEKRGGNIRAVHCDIKSSGKCHRHCPMNKFSWMLGLQVLVLIPCSGYWRRAVLVYFGQDFPTWLCQSEFETLLLQACFGSAQTFSAMNQVRFLMKFLMHLY